MVGSARPLSSSSNKKGVFEEHQEVESSQVIKIETSGDLQAMTIQQLRTMSKKVGISARGSKHDIVSALKCFVDNEKDGKKAKQLTSGDKAENLNIVAEVLTVRQRKTRGKPPTDDSANFVVDSENLKTNKVSVDIISEYQCDEPHDNEKAMEKDAALRFAISRVASEFGRESMLSLQRFFGLRYTPIVSTGSLKLDLALGVGGLPKGRIVEIYGPESSGKTTLALHIIKEAQKNGGYCAFLDVENALDPFLAESIGVNTDNLLIARPNSAENLLSIAHTLARSGSVEVIVVDSVAALTFQCELDVGIDGHCREVQSRLMTKALKRISSTLCQSKTLLVFLNQVRRRPSEGFGSGTEITCGGNALEFYSAVRLKIARKGLIQKEDEIAGLSVCVQIVKNKLAPAMTNADLDIIYGRGFAYEAEILEMACQQGVVTKRGSGYCIEGEILKDKYEAERYLAEYPEIRETVVRILRSQMFDKR